MSFDPTRAEPLDGFPGEYVVYVHHADTEAEARAFVARDCPDVAITFLEPLKAGKWRVCVKPRTPVSA